MSINLTFHGVGERPPDLSRGERDVWLDEARFLAILDAVAGHDDVAISFDDGNRSDVTHALPALRARGLEATFFVVGARLGAPGYVDAHDLRALAAAGMTIGSHGMSHRPWRGLDDDALHEELVDARRRLEKVVGRPVATASCPFGAYDRRVLRSLRRAGYDKVFTSDGGAASPEAWLQPRTTLRRDAEPAAVRSLCAGARRGHATRRIKLAVKRWR